MRAIGLGSILSAHLPAPAFRHRGSGFQPTMQGIRSRLRRASLLELFTLLSRRKRGNMRSDSFLTTASPSPRPARRSQSQREPPAELAAPAQREAPVRLEQREPPAELAAPAQREAPVRLEQRGPPAGQAAPPRPGATGREGRHGPDRHDGSHWRAAAYNPN